MKGRREGWSSRAVVAVDSTFRSVLMWIRRSGEIQEVLSRGERGSND